MSASLFTEDFKPEPYWWDRSPRPDLDEPVLPKEVEVAVVGSGYTGLHAALQTARGGRSTLVLDAEDAGWGCSTRNGGQISTSVKPGFEALARRYGAEQARAVLREGRDALAWIGEFVAAEGIDCDFKIAGRFHAAHCRSSYRRLARSIAVQPEGLEVEAHLIPRSEQRCEIGSDAYFGGVLYPGHASLDPGRYHQGLLERVLQAGATVAAHCPVTALEPGSGGFLVTTARGEVRARDVVLATNGYTGAFAPWHRRRVIPIGSYVIATEPLPEALLDRLIPRDRVVSDTRRVVYYYRASPDRRRILFGGRVSHAETDSRVSGPRLHGELVRIFPELAGTRISHSWVGFVAYSFDTLAHTGRQEGLYYAMGYCGSGVSMASYLGMRTGQRVLGLPEGRSAFERLDYPGRWFHRGNPWFLAPSVLYYRWRDRLDL